MARYWADEVSYHIGCGSDNKTAAFTLTHSDLVRQNIDHAFVVTWNGTSWDDQHTLTWAVAGVCQCEQTVPKWIAVGVNGEALVVEGTSGSEEIIGNGNDAPRRTGLLRSVRSIEGRPYAVGMCRQVYRRLDKGLWERRDDGCRLQSGDTSIVGFESIDGFSENDLYAVGLRGEIWHFDGTSWSSIDSPTNVILTEVCCAGDGKVYACGQRGTLIRGRGHKWDLIHQQSVKDDLWGIAWFKDHLYVSTLYYVAVLEDMDLKIVTDDGSPSSTYQISTTANQLWSIGPREVATFDGSTWEAFD